ncbi:MAG: hypothetical protein KDB53_19555, partial [Planctomycetes bacterium]|nr:hypothetical protein [Planctomycetota bacterium]
PALGYILSVKGDADPDGLDQIVKQRFPEYPGRFDTGLDRGVLNQSSTVIKPAVYEIDYNEVEDLIAGQPRGGELDISEAIRAFQGEYRGTISCSAIKQHFFRVAEKKGGHRYLVAPTLIGLTEGLNPIQIEATLRDGTRVSRSFDVRAELKDKSKFVMQSRQFLADARTKLDEKRNFHTLNALHQALGGLAYSLLNQGTTPKDILELANEMVSLHADLRSAHQQDKKMPMNVKTALRLVEHVRFRCSMVANSASYEILKRALSGACDLPGTESERSEVAVTEKYLAEMIIRATGDLRLGRSHWERSMMLRRGERSLQEVQAEIDNFWPTGPFWN